MSKQPNLMSAYSLRDALFRLAEPDDIAEEVRIRGWEDRRHLLKEKKYYHSDDPIMRSLLSALQCEKVIAYGRMSNGFCEHTKIPSYLWCNKLFLDLKEGEATWSGPPEITISDIHILPQKSGTPALPETGAGRPPDYDWNKIIARFLVEADPEKPLRSSAALTERIQCIALNIYGNKQPGDSTVRGHFVRFPNFWRNPGNRKDNQTELLSCGSEIDEVIEELMFLAFEKGIPSSPEALYKKLDEIRIARRITKLSTLEIYEYCCDNLEEILIAPRNKNRS